MAARPSRAAVAALAVGLAGVAAPSPVRAAEPLATTVTGQESTSFQLWSMRTSDDELVTRSPLTHSFSLHVQEDAPLPRLAFHTDFRGTLDLASQGFRADVLTAYFEASPVPGRVTMRLGRQVRFDGAAVAGPTRFDGVALDVRLPFRLRVEAWSGVPVATPTYFTDTTTPDVSAWGAGWVGGAAASLHGHARTALRLGWRGKSRSGDLARSDLSLDFSQRMGRGLGIRFAGSFNLLLRRPDELLAGIDLRPGTRVTASVEYDRFRPSFDADSVFNVFRQDAYDEVRGRVTFLPGLGLSPWVAAGVQVWPEAVDASGAAVEGVASAVVDVEGGLGWRPPGGHRVDLRGRYAGGWTGHRARVALSGEGRPLPWLSAFGGVDVQRYAFDLQPGMDGTYVTGTVGAAVRPRPWVSVSGDVQAMSTRWIEGNLWVRAEARFLLGWRKDRPGALTRARGWEPSPGPVARAAALDRALGPAWGDR